MNAKNAVLVAGVASLMLMTTVAQCRDFGVHRSANRQQHVDLSGQPRIVSDIATRKGFVTQPQSTAPITQAAAASKASESTLGVCLSRCAGPTDVVVMRRAWLSSSGAVDLNDAVMAARPIKMAMGLNWQALPNLQISADYERKMSGDNLKTAVVVAEEVGARMQLGF